jgi:hypothetical protein
MKTIERHDLASARRLLPLIRVITSEVRERREMLTELRETQRQLQNSSLRSPEGLSLALADLDHEIRIEERGLDEAVAEFGQLDLEVRSLDPLVIHIPGRTSEGDVVFCWEEGRQFTQAPEPSENPEGEPSQLD